MRKALIPLALIYAISCIPLACGADFSENLSATLSEAAKPAKIPNSWKWSLAPLAASQVLDIASSYGMRELNPALAGADGRFGAKAAAMKIGVVGALMGVEYLIVKAHPGAARVLSKINWSGAALTTSFAVHNYSIR